MNIQIFGTSKCFDTKCKDKDTLALIQYIADEDKDEKSPDIWKDWK